MAWRCRASRAARGLLTLTSEEEMTHDEQSSKQIDAVLELICRDTPARRELLWLRAIEAEDQFSLALLERGDPTLRPRMVALLAERGLPAPDHPESRKEVYAAFWHEHFVALAARMQRPSP
jgi:hypothetical protein